MGKSKRGETGEYLKRSSSVDPASRPLEWKLHTFEAAASLLDGLDRSRDHTESIRVLFDILSGSLGIERHALYLDEGGTGDLALIRFGGIEANRLPRSICAGSAFVSWLGRSWLPRAIDDFFRSSSRLTETEMEVQDSFVRSSIGSACALRFGGEIMGLYSFSSLRKDGIDLEEMHATIGMLTGIASATVAGQLICAESGSSSMIREKNLEKEFKAVRSAVLEKTASDLATSLGVLKSGLWSINIEPEDGSVMVDMARDAAARLEAKIGELVSLGGIDWGRDDVMLEQIEVGEIVEDVTREMIAPFEKKELTLSVRNGAGGRKLRAERGRFTYILRSVIEHIVHSSATGSKVEIAWSVSNPGPEAEERPFFEIYVAGGRKSKDDDPLEAVLDSIVSGSGDEAGPPVDSGLTLSEYILESYGGRLIHDDDGSGISIRLPLDY
jgi:hypothetical protein